MNIFKKVICTAGLLLFMAPLPLRAEPEIILDTVGNWRSYFAYSQMVIADEKGKLEKVGVDNSSPLPPEGWMAAEFDDFNWVRQQDVPFSNQDGYWLKTGPANNSGVVNMQSNTIAISDICIRGKFNVPVPSRAGKLNLSLTYRGGVVVYINGKEIARGHLPKDVKLPADASAEAYTKEAYLDDKGILLAFNDKYAEQLVSRLRTLENIVITPDMLIKGTNVLAIEVHRSAMPKEVYEKIKGGKADRFPGDNIFDGCGLVTARLTTAGGGVTPNVVRPSKTQIWNSSPLTEDFDTDWGDPTEPLRPINLAGARNGFFSGKVVVGSTSSIKRVKAVITDLSGKNGEKIPSTAVRIRYAAKNMIVDNYENFRSLRFDRLEEVPPKEVLVREVKATNLPRNIGSPAQVFGAVQPIWITINVPADAKPADYEGELSITVDSASFKVPVKLRVYNYKIPNPSEFLSFTELIQSPETLAVVYNVPLWSEKHWKLIEKSLSYVGAMGTKTCYIPLICKTNMGNTESMVRWVKDKDKYKYDFTIMEKYLDLVEKYQGKPSIVSFYVWDHFLEASGEYFKGKNVSKDVDEGLAESIGKGPEVTVLNNGKTTDFTLPMYSDSAAKPLWKPLVEELKTILKKRKLEKTIMLGIVSDREPTLAVLSFWKDLLPDTPWVKHAHTRAGTISIPCGYTGTVLDLNTILHSMIKNGKASNGWKGKELSTFFPRNILNSYPVATFRMISEITSHGNQRGVARIGADFWALKSGAAISKFGSQHGSGVLASDGRFPKASWLNLNIRISVLAFGPDGAIATARYEMMREGVQECEARIAIEKAIDENKLRADQSKRFERLFSERDDAIYSGFYDNRYDFYKPKGNGGRAPQSWAFTPFKSLASFYLSSGWQEKSADLYEAAAEASGSDKKSGFAVSYREMIGAREPVKPAVKK